MSPSSPQPNPSAADWRQRIDPFLQSFLRAFHRYANWLVSISWRRFIFLSIVLVIATAILHSLPPFTWKVKETVSFDDAPATPGHKQPKPPKPPKPPKAEAQPKAKAEAPRPPASGAEEPGISIQIDQNGVRISPKVGSTKGATAAASAAPAASAAAAEGAVLIKLPPGIDREAVRAAIEQARAAITEAAEQARETQQELLEAERQAHEDALAAAEDGRRAAEAAAAAIGARGPRHSVRTIEWGDFLVDLALLWVAGSAIIKATYKGRVQAEVKAAQATEVAESESLKRQVIEARMAAMQAQVEPHFLFNTLASIDHLIETDPPRASQMQKNLIALLRASMPTMREANASGVRDLGRELAVIRPYLEILKVRMEERLATEIDVPEGLMSAEFPPMMIQSLVENAIKHGLEPKPEGGTLKVKAKIVHGKLAVSVADTGLGFGRAATGGTGVGLANIRERLQLLHGGKATLTVTENQPSGTVVVITVPYRSLDERATS